MRECPSSNIGQLISGGSADPSSERTARSENTLTCNRKILDCNIFCRIMARSCENTLRGRFFAIFVVWKADIHAFKDCLGMIHGLRLPVLPDRACFRRDLP